MEVTTSLLLRLLLRRARHYANFEASMKDEMVEPAGSRCRHELKNQSFLKKSVIFFEKLEKSV
jgi:hypothetical protein